MKPEVPFPAQEVTHTYRLKKKTNSNEQNKFIVTDI